MTWLLLEAGLAGLLLILIVWWTLPKNKGDAPPPASRDAARTDDNET